MTYLRTVQTRLDGIRAQNRYREVTGEQTSYFADFSSNDYLALAADSRMVEALRRAQRVGAGGARLLGGRHREHWLLEQDIAQWLRRERALVFSSGYMAALGVLQSLAPGFEIIYSDSLNHASLIDGIRASGLQRQVYAHAQPPPASQRRGGALIVTETVFGMDGDTADLPAMIEDLRDDDVVLVDEAHALGVLGVEGAGIAAGIDDERLIVLGTLSKAIGSAGGFVAGPARVIELLVNTARSFIFDTALPPAIALAARVGIMLARRADDRRACLFAKAQRLRAGLRSLGYSGQLGETPIVPVHAGDEERALELMQHCLERGIYAPAVRPPTVPAGTSRLRISVRADHTDEQIDSLLECLSCTAIS
jgi:8-amino-7-oxononanoate synthase